MKKGLIFAATVASVAMTACTNDEVMDLNVENDEICFRSEMSTRGRETTNGTIDRVYVTAKTENSETYFSNVEFKKNKGIFYSEGGTYHWPGFSSLNFYAHYPSTDDLDATLKGLMLFDVKPNLAISKQYDFVTAIATGSKKDTDGVYLNFSHNMAQVEVMAKNTNPAYTYRIRGMKLGNFKSDANFDMSLIGTDESPWDIVGPTASYSITYFNPVILDGNNSTPKSLMNNKGNAMIIPQKLTKWAKTAKSTGAYIGVLVQISTKDAQVYPSAQYKYAWAAIPVEFELVEGQKYVLTLDFSNGAGVVGPQEDYSMDGDNEGSLEGEIDEDMANNHLGEDILGGDVMVIPSVGSWDGSNSETVNY